MANPKGNEAALRESRFKAAWKSGATRTIRVPVVLADATLEYAHRLDDGVESPDTMNGSKGDVKVNTTQFIDTSDSTNEIEQLKAELAELRSQLETVQSTSSVAPPPEIELPGTYDILDNLRAERKKTKADADDIKAILGIIEKSWQTHPDGSI